MLGGVNMLETQIYIKNILKREKIGRCRLPTGGYLTPPPRGVYKYH